LNVFLNNKRSRHTQTKKVSSQWHFFTKNTCLWLCADDPTATRIYTPPL